MNNSTFAFDNWIQKEEAQKQIASAVLAISLMGRMERGFFKFFGFATVACARGQGLSERCAAIADF